jgi:hypothetical protein
VEDGTQGVGAVHAAFISVLEKEMADGRGSIDKMFSAP